VATVAFAGEPAAIRMSGVWHLRSRAACGLRLIISLGRGDRAVLKDVISPTAAGVLAVRERSVSMAFFRWFAGSLSKPRNSGIAEHLPLPYRETPAPWARSPSLRRHGRRARD